jgi:alanine racemase
MGTGTLQIDLEALAANWRALDAMTGCETAAVVKADGYGLGAARVATRLAKEGVRRFFVAVAEEGATLRKALGEGPEDQRLFGPYGGRRSADRATRASRPCSTAPSNSPATATRSARCALRHPARQRHEPAGDGARRLGRPARGGRGGPITLVMSHLACADEPDHPANAAQLKAFNEMTEGVAAPRSLAATGGILLGPDYHFDLTRPGIGLYGGLPFTEATPVVRLSLPVIQTRDLAPGETVGYGCTFTATRPTKIATVSAGYADGLIRAASNRATLWAGDTPCPLAGRVSMDLLTVDVTDAGTVPDTLDILGPHQTVDTLADAAGTIGYEILTSLGPRYSRAETAP